jgi:hypothetical protein
MTSGFLNPTDADDLAALHGDREVMRYIDGRPVPCEVVEHQTLPALLREYQEPPDGFGCWAAIDKATGVFLDWFSLRPANSRGSAAGSSWATGCAGPPWAAGTPPRERGQWSTRPSPSLASSGWSQPP